MRFVAQESVQRRRPGQVDGGFRLEPKNAVVGQAVTRSRHPLASVVAAMLAMLMLSYATALSAPMQARAAQGDGAIPICGDSDPATAAKLAAVSAELGLATAPGGGRHKPGEAHPHGSCLYCAAAAHAAVLGHVLEAQPSVSMGRLAFFRPSPPAFEARAVVQPRARGPPAGLLTA